jgi:hypothetical protein
MQGEMNHCANLYLKAPTLVMTTSNINELLAGLGQHLGMQGLRLDAAGCCQLVFDQRWLVTLMHQGAISRIALHCPVSSAQSAQGLGTAALLAMLQANFLGRGTGRCQLSICTEGRACLLLELALAETDNSVLVHALEQLLNQAETWSQWLESGFNAAAAAPSQPSQTQPHLQPPFSADLQSPFADTAAAIRSHHPQGENSPSPTRPRDWTHQRV